MGKWTVVTVELVDVSVECFNGAIAEELIRWLQGVIVSAPWLREVKWVFVSGVLGAK